MARRNAYGRPVSTTDLPQDHFVSRGYQQNFATSDKRVTVISTSSGELIDADRPIKSNFRERGFTTFLEAGVSNDLLERAFVSVEGRVLNEIRTIGVDRCGPQQKADVANLFAIHLVRSPAFKEFHRDIGNRFRELDVPRFAENPEYVERFVASEGRAPRDGELRTVVLRGYDEIARDPMSLVTTMIRQHDAIAEKLNGFHLQVIAIDGIGLPGFVVGDTPVVHADLMNSRYGFRDRVALGDANFIIGPLTRTTAACFSASRLRPEVIKTREMVDAINAIFLRAASGEVACHPDDAGAVKQVHSRLDRLPPSILTG